MPIYAPTPKTRVRRRLSARFYDRDIVHRILDEALVAHVGFVVGRRAARAADGNRPHCEDVFIHGSANNHMLHAARRRERRRALR